MIVAIRSRRAAALAVCLSVLVSQAGLSPCRAELEPITVTSANDPTKPVPGGVRWFGRKHAEYLQRTKAGGFELCFLGDSITDGWPGDLFAQHFGAKYKAANFGIGGDRTENVLWRLERGELVGTSPKLIVLLIGTNNSGMNTPPEIALGVSTVVKKLRSMLPETKVLVLGILPRRDANRAKTDAANVLLAKLDDGGMVRFHDFGGVMLEKDGKLREGMLSDDVHLTRTGYAVWAKAMAPVIAEMMGAAPANSSAAGDAKPAQRVTAWNLAELSRKPSVTLTNERPANGMTAFFYEGAVYKGKPTKVFAYYAAPAGTPPKGGWPAVVCAHGGGGTAFPDWVRKWNSRGYAAISMDLEGHLPGGNHFGVEGNHPADQGHPDAGPKRIDYFGDRDLPDTEQWFYHAVADVIRANSLLRSMKDINPEKIGLTGISWGGTVVSTAAGVDPRFAFVIPVYGAGFIHESDNPGLAQWFPPKNMTEKQFSDYRTKWDPAAHLPHAKMPMLFVSSVADPVFQIDIFDKSVRAAGGPATLSIKPWMIHGHGNGWNDPVEIYAFADHVIKGGPALPQLGPPKINPDTKRLHATYTSGFSEAWVYYTTGGGAFKDRKWQFIECTIGQGEVVAKQPLPNGTTAYLIYGFRSVGGGRDNHSSSPLVVVKP